MHNIMESKGQTLILILFRFNSEIYFRELQIFPSLPFSFAIFLFHFKRPQEPAQLIQINRSCPCTAYEFEKNYNLSFMLVVFSFLCRHIAMCDDKHSAFLFK